MDKVILVKTKNDYVDACPYCGNKIKRTDWQFTGGLSLTTPDTLDDWPRMDAGTVNADCPSCGKEVYFSDINIVSDNIPHYAPFIDRHHSHGKIFSYHARRNNREWPVDHYVDLKNLAFHRHDDAAGRPEEIRKDCAWLDNHIIGPFPFTDDTTAEQETMLLIGEIGNALLKIQWDRNS